MWFKKETKKEKLEKQYKKLLEEAYKLSTINRSESDKKTAEANLVLELIQAIKE